MFEDLYKGIVVDRIIGLEKESWKENGVKFHRDDEYHRPLMTEEDVEELSRHIKSAPQGQSFCLDTDKALMQAIDDVNDLRSYAHLQMLSFSESDMDDMRRDFVIRLRNRLKKYSDGKDVVLRGFPGGVYGYRFVLYNNV